MMAEKSHCRASSAQLPGRGEGGGAQEQPGRWTTAHRGRTPGDPRTVAVGTSRGGSPRRGLCRAAGGAGGRPACSGAPPTSGPSGAPGVRSWWGPVQGSASMDPSPGCRAEQDGGWGAVSAGDPSTEADRALGCSPVLPSMGCGPASLDPVCPQSPSPSPSGPDLLPLCPQASPAVLLGLPQPSCLCSSLPPLGSAPPLCP